MAGAVLERLHEQTAELELVNLARQGDEAAFEEIVQRYSPRVFRIASQFFRRREAVEDAAQEVFLKVYTQLDSYEGRGSLEGWITRIATNTCINTLRSAKRRPEAPITELTEAEDDWLAQKLIDAADSRPSVENHLVAVNLAEKLLAMVPAEDRLVLSLMDGEELSVKEVVDVTGWSESKVKMRAMRARQRMRQAVEKLFKNKKSVESAGR